MARTKSAVLTPADKRAVIKDAKAKQKTLELQIKQLVKDDVSAGKKYTKEMKAREKLAVTEAARHDRTMKQMDKAITAARKALDKQTAQVNLLVGTPPVVVAVNAVVAKAKAK